MVRHAAKLSPADQVCPQVHAAILTSYRNDNVDRAYNIMAEGIRRLVRTLPYIGGHIVHGEQGYTHLVWDDNVTDKEVVLQRVDARHILPSYQELADRRMDLHAYDYDFPLAEICSREFSPRRAEPALVVGLFEVRGGFIIKFAPYHQIVDGYGIFIVYSLWAALSAGREPDVPLDPLGPLTRYDHFVSAVGLAPSPHHQRAATSGDDVEITFTEADRTAERTLAPFSSTGKVVQLARELFVISEGSIAELHEAVTNAAGGKRPSTVSLIASLFWALLTEVREQRGNNHPNADSAEPPRSAMLMAAESRARFPELDPYYIGNFIAPALTTIDVADLVAAPTADAVGRTSDSAYAAIIARACQRLTTNIRAATDPAQLRPRLQMISNFPDARLLGAAGGSTMGANDIFLTSWINLSLYPDFGPGVGGHECVRGAPTGRTTERATYSYIVVLPRRTGSDGQTIFEIFLSCEEDDMRYLQQHPFLKSRLYTLPVFREPEPELKAKL